VVSDAIDEQVSNVAPTVTMKPCSTHAATRSDSVGLESPPLVRAAFADGLRLADAASQAT